MNERGADSEPTRILYVTSRFPSVTSTFVANEMTAVQALDYEVYVATLWPVVNAAPDAPHRGHPVERPFLPRVESTSLTAPRTWALALRAALVRPSVLATCLRLLPGHLRSPWLFGKLLAVIPKGLAAGARARELGIERIHAHFITTPTTVALLAAEVAGVPFTATAHAFDITSRHPKRVNGSVLLKCRRAEAIVTISEYNRADMLRRWPELESERLEVIYNGIDTSAFAPRTGARPLESGGALRVLSVSSLNAKKGFEYLVRAVALLRGEETEVLLDIYGDGPDRAMLTELITTLGVEEHVRLHGTIDQDRVAALCREADVFVLASVPLDSDDADGLPTVLIEALSAELPTVSTQVTGIPEIVVDGETGLCVPPRDPAAIARALRWMREHPAEAREMGSAGRRLVLRQFDRQRAARRLDTLWRTGRPAIERGDASLASKSLK